MPYIKFQGYQFIGPGEEDFQGFYFLLARPLFWSRDLNHFMKFCSALHKIWLQLTQWLLRRQNCHAMKLLGQRQRMPLTSCIYKFVCIHEDN